MVLLTARSSADAARAADELADAGEKLSRSLDITNRDSVASLFASLTEIGFIDILVNNAGVMLETDTTADNVDLGVVRQTLDTNLMGHGECRKRVCLR